MLALGDDTEQALMLPLQLAERVYVDAVSPLFLSEKYGSFVTKLSAVYCGLGLTVTAGVALGSVTWTVPVV
jgi:hypothetical protein